MAVARSTSRDLLALGGFVVLCLAVSALGGAVTATSVGTWYPTLHKPFFTPPDWVFAPVWTTLYVVMAVAAWRVWRGGDEGGDGARRRALVAFALQLGLNLIWSFLFFGFRWVGAALVDVVVLVVLIAVTAVLFRRVDHLAGALFVPYLLWVGYATALNGAIWYLN